MQGRMVGARIDNRMPWSECHCGCGAGSKARKAERRMAARKERQAWKKEVW
jgi:hypothetical protein